MFHVCMYKIAEVPTKQYLVGHPRDNRYYLVGTELLLTKCDRVVIKVI